MGEAPREVVRKLGNFLADLTHDRPAERVHAEILERLRDPELELDHRLAGIYLHAKDFIPVWSGIRNGITLPENSWEAAVLPVVVHYSDTKAVKSNLETATNMWLAARTAVTAPQELPAPIENEFLPWDEPVPSEQPRLLPALDYSPPPPSISGPPRHFRRWVPQAAALTLVAIAALLFVNRGAESQGKYRAELKPPPIGGLAQRALPDDTLDPSAPGSLGPSPSVSTPGNPGPTASPGVSDPPRTDPPQTTPNPPVIVRPSAPRNLVWDRIGATTVSLSWAEPLVPGTGGILYYEIYRDGVKIHWTYRTYENVTELQPDTTYTFTVIAISNGGGDSPHSDPLTVTTDEPPEPTPTDTTTPGEPVDEDPDGR